MSGKYFYKSYKQYLHSDEWESKRDAVIQRSRLRAKEGDSAPFGVCERCSYSPWRPCLQVHHKTYERIYNERLEDLILLCPKCHREVHNLEKKKKGAGS